MVVGPILKRYSALLAVAVALFDIGCIVAAYLLASLMTLPSFGEVLDHTLGNLAYLAICAGVWCFVAIGQELYASRRSDALVPQLFAAAKAVFTALVLSIFIMALFIQQGLDRGFVLLFSLFFLLLIIGFRSTVRLGLWRLRRRGFNYRHILIIGANEHTVKLAKVILSHEQYGYRIVGFLEDDEGQCKHLASYAIAYLGKIRDLEQLLAERVIDVVYLSLPVHTHYETIESIAHLCEGVGVSVRLIADLFPVDMATSDIMRLGDIPVLSLSAVPTFRHRVDLRRAAEAAVAFILFVVLLPLFALIAVLVKLDSPGPLFARESRLATGRKGRFDLLKFRTVAVGAPIRESAPNGEATTGRPPAQGPPPLTRVGRLLRRYSLDELPELINVLQGHMSFTEPRTGALWDAGDEAAAGLPTADGARTRNGSPT